MDINSIVQDLMKKIGQDSDFKSDFLSNPTKAIESIVGIDLPDDQINKVIETVMSKIGDDALSDPLGTLKKLF